MSMELVHRVVCLFMSQLSLVLMPAHEGMARLSWPGWLVRYRDDLPAQRQSPIPVLTEPVIEQFRWSRLTLDHCAKQPLVWEMRGGERFLYVSSYLFVPTLCDVTCFVLDDIS